MNRTALTLALLVLSAGCMEEERTTDSASVETGAVGADTAPQAAADGFLDPNEATRAELTGAGLDSAQAEALVAGRPYATMDEVDEALGLDDEQRDRVYTSVWLPLDLNSASEQEILLIPGVGDRMAHEFEEYRPYRGIEQFRREIGKYVDDAEVARLERYVTIR